MSEKVLEKKELTEEEQAKKEAERERRRKEREQRKAKREAEKANQEKDSNKELTEEEKKKLERERRRKERAARRAQREPLTEEEREKRAKEREARKAKREAEKKAKEKAERKAERKAVFKKGLIQENAVFIGLLGLCPALAVTNSLESAIGMSILVILILMITNIIISLIRNFIPNEVRIPVYIVVIATVVTAFQMLVHAFLPALYSTLGVFIALITVNCIILGRAEAFASKNSVGLSILDALGVGLGFAGAIILIGFIRELFGTGTIVLGKVFTFIPEIEIIPSSATSKSYFIGILTQAPGAFIVMGLLLGMFIHIGNRKQKKEKRGAKK